MRLPDDVTVEVPLWARLVLAFFGILFAGLAVWVTGMAGRSGFPARAVALVASLLALALLVSALRGRIWKWMWFIG